MNNDTQSFERQEAPDAPTREEKPKSSLKLKILAVALAILVIVLAFFPIKDLVVQQFIVHEATTQLDQVKSGDVSAIVELTDGKTTLFDDYDIDETTFLESYFEGFDYTLGDVVVKGGYIDVACTLHTKDFRTLLVGTTTNLVTYQTAGQVVKSGSLDIKPEVGRALVDATASCTTYMDRTVHLRIIEKDGSWQLDNATDIVAELVVGDDPAQFADDIASAASDLLGALGQQLIVFAEDSTSGLFSGLFDN